MATDKSLRYYGWLYHMLFDPPLREARRLAVDLIPARSSVLDIACGTGLLCLALHEEKQCKVVGIDLSLRMLRFAEKLAKGADVTFLHHDATDLAELEDPGFDYATMLFLIHELPRRQQHRVLSEALRVANRVLIIDSRVPLPENRNARGVRFVEATFGREHHGHFESFVARGGITGVLEESGLPVKVERRATFWRDCREAVLVAKQS